MRVGRAVGSAPRPRRSRTRAGGRFRLATLALLVAAAASPAAAAFLAPAGSETVRAGQVITVRWTAPAEEVRELELLLLLDADSAPVRLTEQLRPEDGAYRWRVPNLPSPAARLQIRFSRGLGEELGSTSAPFRILPRATSGLAELGRRDGEWWVVTAGAGAVGCVELQRRVVCAELLGAWPLEPLGSSGEREPLLAPARLGAGPGSDGACFSMRPAVVPVIPRASDDVPQRE